MSNLNKICAAMAFAFIALAGCAPYAIDAACGTHLVQTLNKVK